MICVLNRREGAVVFFFFLLSPRSRLLSGIEKVGIKLKSLLSIIGVEWEKTIDMNSLKSKQSQQQLYRITQSFSFCCVKTKTTVETFHMKTCKVFH